MIEGIKSVLIGLSLENEDDRLRPLATAYHSHTKLALTRRARGLAETCPGKHSCQSRS